MDAFSFALFADAQYARRPSMIGRHFNRSAKKITWYANAFAQEKLAFAVHLGDLVDWSGQPGKAARDEAEIRREIERFPFDTHFVLGNHDVDSMEKEELLRRWHYPDDQGYYAFDHGGVHFIVLDSNADENGQTYRPGQGDWTRSFIDAAQLAWLESDLRETACETVVIFVHAVLNPVDNPHVVINAAQVRDVLEHADKEIVVFQGHMHPGYYAAHNGIGYYTLKATVEGRNDFCYWIVEVKNGEMQARIADESGVRRLNLLPLTVADEAWGNHPPEAKLE